MATWRHELVDPPADPRARTLWLQHGAGFIVFEDVRRYAMERIDPTLTARSACRGSEGYRRRGVRAHDDYRRCNRQPLEREPYRLHRLHRPPRNTRQFEKRRCAIRGTTCEKVTECAWDTTTGSKVISGGIQSWCLGRAPSHRPYEALHLTGASATLLAMQAKEPKVRVSLLGLCSSLCRLGGSRSVAVELLVEAVPGGGQFVEFVGHCGGQVVGLDAVVRQVVQFPGAACSPTR